MAPSLDIDAERRPIGRRDVLVALGGAAAASTLGASGSTASATPLTVRVYPGPVPLRAWVRYGFDGMARDWPPPFRDALEAIRDALEQVSAYAADRLPSLSVAVERGEPIRYPFSSVPSLAEGVLPSLETVLEVFRGQLRDRDALTGSTCHLLLCWAPLNFRVGYGGTLSPHAVVGVADGAAEATGDAQAVANVGATEAWDSRAVTRNVAIHEVLHALLSPEATEAVGPTACDHDLGTAVRTGEDGRTLEVSPLATGYAGVGRDGLGTRWDGTGCSAGDRAGRDDLADVDRVRYTTRLGDATLEAVTRHLEAVLGP